MVDFVTNQIKRNFYLYLVKKAFYFVEWNISFLFVERNYVQVSKYVMVLGVYLSRIDFKGVVA